MDAGREARDVARRITPQRDVTGIPFRRPEGDLRAEDLELARGPRAGALVPPVLAPPAVSLNESARGIRPTIVVGGRPIPRPIGEDRGGVISAVHHSPVKIWAGWRGTA